MHSIQNLFFIRNFIKQKKNIFNHHMYKKKLYKKFICKKPVVNRKNNKNSTTVAIQILRERRKTFTKKASQLASQPAIHRRWIKYWNCRLQTLPWSNETTTYFFCLWTSRKKVLRFVFFSDYSKMMSKKFSLWSSI